MWKIRHSGTRKTWVIKSAERFGRRDRPLSASVILPVESDGLARRVPDPGEPLAYCADCREWTPMRWRPAAERGKRVEAWYECENCGGRDLTLRYLPLNEAMRQHP